MMSKRDPNRLKQQRKVMLRTGTSNKNEKLCHCDADCTKYGDCCLDKARQTIQQRTSVFHSNWECKQLTSNVSDVMSLKLIISDTMASFTQASVAHL